jgi:elongation factor Ts
MAYTATDVKNLRETTGAGMMDCKKALDETGDLQKAVDYLRAKGLAAAAKKQSRVAAEGMISSNVKDKIGALVEVNCETDFVAKNDSFQAFTTAAANMAVDNNLTTVEELLAAKTSNGLTIKDNVSELTIKIGEKIDLRRVVVVKLQGHGMIGSYVHSGKIGVLTRVETDKDINGHQAFKDLVKDLCMQIAAADPKFLNSSEIDETFKAKEAEIYAAQLKEQGKPEAMIPNIVKGKLNKLASDVCLYEQSFVKDPDITVGNLIEKVAKETGASIKVTQFVKLNLGEGIEKKSENFAEEIAKITGNN